MKRKFWIALLPLCGCFCVEAGAQSLSALKSELSTPDPSYGSRVEVEEHDGAASAVRSMEGRRAPEKVRGYRVRIYFDNVQHARSQAESVMARFREIYPDIPAYMDYDNIPYFKVTVGNCLTMEEAIILWGRIRDAFDRAFIVPESMPLELFGQQPVARTDGRRRGRIRRTIADYRKIFRKNKSFSGKKRNFPPESCINSKSFYTFAAE